MIKNFKFFTPPQPVILSADFARECQFNRIVWGKLRLQRSKIFVRGNLHPCKYPCKS